MFGLDLNLKNEPSISTDFENLTTLSKHRSIPLPPTPTPLRNNIQSLKGNRSLHSLD